MASALKTLARWSKAPARDVSAPSSPPWINMVRGLAARATTPLLPDDYLSLLNPLWSARELRGEIVDVRPETEDSATVVIRPGWGGSPATTGPVSTWASGCGSTAAGTGGRIR